LDVNLNGALRIFGFRPRLCATAPPRLNLLSNPGSDGIYPSGWGDDTYHLSPST